MGMEMEKGMAGRRSGNEMHSEGRSCVDGMWMSGFQPMVFAERMM